VQPKRGAEDASARVVGVAQHGLAPQDGRSRETARW
jgi:hypothetical protein